MLDTLQFFGNDAYALFNSSFIRPNNANSQQVRLGKRGKKMPVGFKYIDAPILQLLD